MKKIIISCISIMVMILCFVGCSGKNEKEISTGYIYNMEDKSTRTFSESTSIRNIEWAPNSKYFIYDNWEYVRGGVRIKEVNNLEEIEYSFNNKNNNTSINMCYWNKDSKLIISLEDKGEFSFDPNTKVMEQASQEDGQNNIRQELTQEEVSQYRNDFNIPNEKELFENIGKSRFFYYGNKNEVIFCNVSTREKEVVLEAMGVPKWTSKGDKVIYIIPRDGFQSIEERKIYPSNLFDIYLYDFNKKENIKIADYYAEIYCSPDEKYIIFLPTDYDNICDI